MLNQGAFLEAPFFFDISTSHKRERRYNEIISCRHFNAESSSASAHAEKKEFNHKSEAAIVTTGGNSRLQTYNAQTENTYQKGKRSYKLSGHYTLGFAESEELENDEFGGKRSKLGL